MHIDQATAFLYALKPRGIRFGLENTKLVLKNLGNPEKKLKVIHIAGSNGKGSTAAFLSSILQQSGYRVGLFTSPHLVNYRERFQIDGQQISDQAIGDCVDILLRQGLEVDPAEVVSWVEQESMIDKMDVGSWYNERGGASQFCRLTFFECTTILAVMLFAHAEVDVAVMECGMGGRLDATNALSPQVSVITPIHLEHTEWLGDTLGAIAGEKAGIIKDEVPVVCSRQADEAFSVIEQEAQSHGSRLLALGRDFDGWGDYRKASFRYGDEELGPISLGLVGEHQLENAATALGVLACLKDQGWQVDRKAVKEGLHKVSWPGRFERFGPQSEWVLDAAHNPNGSAVLSKIIGELYEGQPVQIVFGVLGDKDAEKMLEQLSAVAENFYLVKSSDARARDPHSLTSLIKEPYQVFDSIDAGMSSADQRHKYPIVVTGSLTVVGEARNWLLKQGIRPTVL
jgi:dihydrofolate synthase/folylpolyglutamate synthase